MNSTNILSGAKFGEKFITEDGDICVFLGIVNLAGLEKVNVAVQCKNNTFGYKIYQLSVPSIISKYKEPIDEEKLDKLSKAESDNYEKTVIKELGKCNCESIMYYYRGFKQGYKKAKEE